MRDLAEWIREGLKDRRVTEAPSTRGFWGIGKHYHANVVWLGYIGKLGLPAAIELAESYTPANREEIWGRLANETGLSHEQCNILSEVHMRFSAEAIAEKLEEGWTPDATYNVVFK